MRQIKFRGKRLGNGEWVYGDLLQGLEDDKYIVISHDEGVTKYEVDPDTVGQFTGLHDKNSKEIYNGDVFVIGTLDGIISWHPNGYWCLHTSKDDVNNYSYISLGEVIEYAIRKKYDYKVIGNIHEKI